jgi:hypothetical protein
VKPIARPTVRETVWILAAAWAFAACGARRAEDSFELHRNLLLAERVEVQVAGGAPAIAAGHAAERLTRSGVFTATVAAPREEGRGPRVLIGDPSTPGMAAVLARLGVEDSGDGRLRLTRIEGAPAVDTLAATVADPARPGLPISVMCGVDTSLLAPRMLHVTPTWRGSLRGWSGGALVVEARLAPSGEVEPDSVRRPFAEQRRLFGDDVKRSRAEIELVLPTDAEIELREYARSLETARAAVVEVFTPGADPPPARVRLFEHPEDMARVTGAWELSSLNPVTGEVRAVVSGDLDDRGVALARSVAVTLGGPPAQPWMLDGLAVSVAGEWWGQQLGPWAARLEDGGLVPPLEEILDDVPVHSPHVVQPLRGVLVGELLRKRGREAFLELWTGARPFAIDQELRTEFAERLRWVRDRNVSRIQEARGETLTRVLHQPLRKGINLCAPLESWTEGDRDARGFGTRACERSLDDALSVGADAVAVVVTGVVDPGLPLFAFEPPRRALAASSSDLALVATMRAARARGMSVMMRPLVLATPSGTWAADHCQETEEAARDFFADYGRFLVHFALVAELGGAELLCAGTELPKSTMIDEEDSPWLPDFTNQNHDRWRELLDRARGAFTGGLTYAADWQGEVDQIGFWQELDFVGQDLYTSLSMPPGEDVRPEDDEVAQRLRNAVRSLVEVARELHRPALVTEVGFASSSKAWLSPMESRGAVDLEEQARLFRCVDLALEQLDLDAEDLGGLYLWNWSTDPDAGREPDRAWTPQNRPAAAAVREMFGG